MGMGVRPDVTLWQGIGCELGLGFAMNFIILAAGHVGEASTILPPILTLICQSYGPCGTQGL
jgi:hypothetical protein